jgi:hypothetical protein
VGPYELHPHERAAIIGTFARPFPADWIGQQEELPGWWLVHREAGAAWIRNGNWAVAMLEIQGEHVVRIEVLDPAASRLVYRRWGWSVTDEMRERLTTGFVVGSDVESALDGLFSSRRIGLRVLGASDRSGREFRWYRIYQSGVLGIAVDEQGCVADIQIVEGEAAFDLAEELAKSR